MNDTLIIDNTTSWKTNIHIETEKYSIQNGIFAETPFSVEIFSTCTTTPSQTNISYTFEANGNEKVPDWVSLNNTTGKLEGTAPTAKYRNTYSFILNSSWTSVPAGNSQQVIEITVSPNTKGTTASSIATVASQSTVMMVGAWAVGTSFTIGFPPSGLYLILQLLQIIILLMIIDPFIPTSIRDYIEGQSFALANFNFLPSPNIPVVNIPVTWLDSKQPIEILKSLGLDSKSSLVNNFSFISIFWVVLLIHIILRYILVCENSEGEQQSKFRVFWNWLKLKLLDIIKYTVYLRLILETHESMLLSATSEINLFDLPQIPDILSFIFAWVILIFSISLPIIAFYYFWINREEYDPNVKFLFMEFFADIRNSKFSRMYMPLVLTRRVLFVCSIIFLNSAPRELIYSILLSNFHIYSVFIINLGSQIPCLAAIIWTKPFQTQINNIIESVNEIFLTFIIILMFGINSKSKWKTYEDFFMTILIIDSLAITGIMIGNNLNCFLYYV